MPDILEMGGVAGPPFLKPSRAAAQDDPEVKAVPKTGQHRVVLGWQHQNDTQAGLQRGRVWAGLIRSGRRLDVFTEPFNSDRDNEKKTLFRDFTRVKCGRINFSMLEMIHPKWAFEFRLPHDQNWPDKKTLREKIRAYLREQGLGLYRDQDVVNGEDDSETDFAPVPQIHQPVPARVQRQQIVQANLSPDPEPPRRPFRPVRRQQHPHRRPGLQTNRAALNEQYLAPDNVEVVIPRRTQPDNCSGIRNYPITIDEPDEDDEDRRVKVEEPDGSTALPTIENRPIVDLEDGTEDNPIDLDDDDDDDDERCDTTMFLD